MMNLKNRILNFLSVGPDELRPLLLLAGTNFLAMLSYVMLKTVRDSVLLARFDLRHLPYIYLAVAFLLLIAFTQLSRWRYRFTIRAMVLASYGMIIIVLAAFYFFLRSDNSLAPPLFYVWVNLSGSIIFAQFWLCFHGMTADRGSRRFISLVAAGAIFGQVIGGLLAGRIAGWLGPERPEILIWMVIVGMSLSAVVLWRAAVSFGHPTNMPPSIREEPEEVGTSRPGFLIVRTPYLRTIALFVILGVVLSTVVDYLFKTGVQNDVAASALPQFFGNFYTVVGVAALLVQLILTPFFLQRFGIATALLTLPASLLAMCVALLVHPVLYLLIALKGLDSGLRSSVYKSAQELLYMPLRPDLRRKVQPIIDSVGERMGDAAGGLFLLIGLNLLGWERSEFLVASLVLLGLWIGIGSRTLRAYVQTLRTQLSGGHFLDNVEDLGIQDLHSLESLLRALNSPHAEQVVHALDLFDTFGKIDLIPSVLLAHQDAEVRLKAIKLFKEAQRYDAWDFLDRLLVDPDEEVRQLALTTLADTEPDFALARVRDHVGDKDPHMRAAAGYCLLKLGGPSDRTEGRSILAQLRNGDAAGRLALAETLGRTSHRLERSWLVDLLRDSDPQVRRATAISAGKGFLPELVEPLSDLFFHSVTVQASRQALIAYGDRAVSPLLNIFAHRDDDWLRAKIIDLLVDIATQTAADALLSLLTLAEEWIRQDSLHAVAVLKARRPMIKIERVALWDNLAQEKELHRFYLARLDILRHGARSDRDTTRLLLDLLGERAAAALERCFLCLELLHPNRDILVAYRRHAEGGPAERVRALAFLDTVLEIGHRRDLLDLMEELPLSQRLQRSGVLRPATPLVALRSLVRSVDTLMAAVAIAAADSFPGGTALTVGMDSDPTWPDILQESLALARLREEAS